MAYQVRQKQRIQEELEITNACGDNSITLKTDINITQVAKELRGLFVKLVETQKNVEKSATDENIEKVGNTFIALLKLIFREEQTQTILRFYESDYAEMISDISPFIFDVVKPAIDKYVSDYKTNLAKNNNLNRRQKRKLKNG